MEHRRPASASASVRQLGIALAATTIATPVLVALLLPAHTATLAPLALVLPFVTMGVLDAALRNGSTPGA